MLRKMGFHQELSRGGLNWHSGCARRFTYAEAAGFPPRTITGWTWSGWESESDIVLCGFLGLDTEYTE